MLCWLTSVVHALIHQTAHLHSLNLQGELAIKNTDLAAATKEAEKLLKEISENTAIAEKEKQKVPPAVLAYLLTSL